MPLKEIISRYWLSRYTFRERMLALYVTVATFSTVNAASTYLWMSVGVVREANPFNLLIRLPPIASLPLLWIAPGILTLAAVWYAEKHDRRFMRTAEIALAILVAFAVIDLAHNLMTLLTILHS